MGRPPSGSFEGLGPGCLMAPLDPKGPRLFKGLPWALLRAWARALKGSLGHLRAYGNNMALYVPYVYAMYPKAGFRAQTTRVSPKGLSSLGLGLGVSL